MKSGTPIYRSIITCIMSAQPTLCITCLLLCITLCISCDVSHRNYPTCNTKPDIVDGLITILPMPLIIIVCLCTCCCICYFNRCCCFRRKEPTSNPGLNLQNLEHRKCLHLPLLSLC